MERVLPGDRKVREQVGACVSIRASYSVDRLFYAVRSALPEDE